MKTFLLILLSASILHSSARAQTAASPIVSDARQELRMGPGDLLSLSVYDCPELTQELRVAADGTIRLALLGDLDVHGMTASEGAQKIERELRDRNLVRNPQVSVSIKEFATQGVTVDGEVQRPGLFQIYGPRTLLDVLSLAGGLTNLADTQVTIKRHGSDGASTTVSLSHDDAKASIANNVQVFPGDLVMVPRAGLVYVLGDVGRPGGFVMQNNGHITLLEALAQAGGANRTASENRALLIHKKADGPSTFTPIPLREIVRGKRQDFELHPNDILYVPNSAMKNITQNAQGIITSMGSASVYAVVR